MDSDYEQVVNVAAKDAAEDQEMGTLGGLMPTLPRGHRGVVGGVAVRLTDPVELLGESDLGQTLILAEISEGFAVPFGNF